MPKNVEKGTDNLPKNWRPQLHAKWEALIAERDSNSARVNELQYTVDEISRLVEQLERLTSAQNTTCKEIAECLAADDVVALLSTKRKDGVPF